jgi:hypothetical protein
VTAHDGVTDTVLPCLCASNGFITVPPLLVVPGSLWSYVDCPGASNRGKVMLSALDVRYPGDVLVTWDDLNDATNIPFNSTLVWPRPERTLLRDPQAGASGLTLAAANPPVPR